MTTAGQLERRNRIHGLRTTSLDGARVLGSCPLCGSRETAPAFRDNSCSLLACQVCDLFFVHPYPATAGQHNRVASGRNPAIRILDCERRYSGERFYYDRHFPLIAEECRGARSLLDVGCGTGRLLELVATQFPRIQRAGIELNESAAQFARRTAACPILEIPVEQFVPEAGEQFDVITLVNVFSHIPSLDRLFASFRSALSPRGKIIIRTTEMTRNVSRWNQAHWGIPDDLHFLGMRTLDFLCAKYGFVVARHIRTPFEDELFVDSRWRQTGRSRLQNAIKRAVLAAPPMLRALKAAYSAVLDRRLFVSFIVIRSLQPK